jgi:hypothetical protein
MRRCVSAEINVQRNLNMRSRIVNRFALCALWPTTLFNSGKPDYAMTCLRSAYKPTIGHRSYIRVGES